MPFGALQQLAVHANVIAPGIGLAAQLRHYLAIHHHASGDNHLFGVAPAGDARLRENLLQPLGIGGWTRLPDQPVSAFFVLVYFRLACALFSASRRALSSFAACAASIPGPASRAIRGLDVRLLRNASTSAFASISASPRYRWASPLVTSPMGSSTGASMRTAGSFSTFALRFLLFAAGALAWREPSSLPLRASSPAQAIFAADFAVFAFGRLAFGRRFLARCIRLLGFGRGLDRGCGRLRFLFYCHGETYDLLLTPRRWLTHRKRLVWTASRFRPRDSRRFRSFQYSLRCLDPG